MTASLDFDYKVRIAVHGLIPITAQERAIKDTKLFQRLRRISQLGMTSLVYPSANHTRFEHSLGAMHVAWRIAKNLRLEEEAQRVIRLAALLHDIAHGPFSHISENVIDRLTGLEKTHEYYGGAAVLYHPDLRELIAEDEREDICRLIVPIQIGEPQFPIEVSFLRNRSLAKDIVAGPADADKMDYLLRDSHHCYVKYGEFDLQKILDSTTVIRSAGVDQLGFKEDAVWALEQLLLARHHMHRQVYAHPTRLATDAMLIRSMEDGITEEVLPQRDFDWGYWNGDPAGFLATYLRWDDQALRQSLTETDGTTGDLARRLIARDLLKEGFRMELQTLASRDGLPDDFIGQILDDTLFTRDRITSIEDAVARQIDCESRMVILSLESVKNPTYRPPAYRMEQEWLPKDIMLKSEEGENLAFVNVSEVFGGTREVERNYLSVYCPLPIEKGRRVEIRKKVKETLLGELRVFYEELN